MSRGFVQGYVSGYGEWVLFGARQGARGLFHASSTGSFSVPLSFYIIVYYTTLQKPYTNRGYEQISIGVTACGDPQSVRIESQQLGIPRIRTNIKWRDGVRQAHGVTGYVRLNKVTYLKMA